MLRGGPRGEVARNPEPDFEFERMEMLGGERDVFLKLLEQYVPEQLVVGFDRDEAMMWAGKCELAAYLRSILNKRT